MPKELKKQTLQQDSIVEALFEIRFSCNSNTPGNLLPGVLYSTINQLFPRSQILDASRLPLEILDSDPNLRYAAMQRFVGDRASVNIGPRSFSVVIPKPYIGWLEFKKLIIICLEKLYSTGFVYEVERYSLRYVNIISAGPQHKEQFNKIQFNGSLGEFDLSEKSSQISTEVIHKGVLNKITIASNTTAEPIGESGSGVISGLLLDIDSIQTKPESNFLESPDEFIEKLHDAETDIFFGVVAPETLTQFGYESE